MLEEDLVSSGEAVIQIHGPEIRVEGITADLWVSLAPNQYGRPVSRANIDFGGMEVIAEQGVFRIEHVGGVSIGFEIIKNALDPELGRRAWRIRSAISDQFVVVIHGVHDPGGVELFLVIDADNL